MENNECFTFGINGVTYRVVETPLKQIQEIHDNAKDDFYFGCTVYDEQTIYLNEALKSDELYSTLRHEVMHAWLWNYGYRASNEISIEQACDIIASACNFITGISREYMEYKEELTNKHFKKRTH